MCIRDSLNTVRAPARNAGDGKNRRIKFHWQVEHAVDKAAVKINIRADAFIDFAFFSNDLRGKLCNGGIELIFIRAALFLRQPLYKAFKDIGARVGERINSVPHSVNQAGACLLYTSGMKSSLKRTTMLVLAVTLHNIPEGLAVGLSFAAAAEGGYATLVSYTHLTFLSTSTIY